MNRGEDEGDGAEEWVKSSRIETKPSREEKRRAEVDRLHSLWEYALAKVAMR